MAGIFPLATWTHLLMLAINNTKRSHNVTPLNLVVLINISYADNVLENSFKPCLGQGFIDVVVSKEIKVG